MRKALRSVSVGAAVEAQIFSFLCLYEPHELRYVWLELNIGTAVLKVQTENLSVERVFLTEATPLEAPVDKKTSIDELNLTTRVRNTLWDVKIHYIEELAQYSERELVKIPNLGRKGLNEIRERLTACGLALKAGAPGNTH